MLYMKMMVGTMGAGLVLAGCAVGPNFHRPEAPTTTGYTETARPRETAAAQGTGGAAQHFVSGQEIPGQWWTLFHSPELDQLIRRALADSPTLAAAQATLREAQEILHARTGGALVPNVDGTLSARRQQTTGAAFGQPGAQRNLFNLFDASVGVSYALDIFGGARRGLEALRSQVDYQRFQLEGAYLTLTSNIVTTAVKESSLRVQIRAMQEMIAAQEKQLGVVERQFELGGVSRPDVLAQRMQLAQTRAGLPPLELALAQTRHRLAVLAGRLPGETVLPEFSLDGIELPQELPVSLPSVLVRQRPDVLASESMLHQASAEIGVATANLFPQITLTGSYGSQSAKVGDLFSSGAGVWSLGAGFLQPLLHGGELTAKRRAAIDAYDQAAAQYRETVLLAFQNVADVLRALDSDAAVLKAQAEAEATARDAVELTQKQFQLGAVSSLVLLNAERQHQQSRINRAQAQAARYADTAALFQALGGGWWNRAASTDAAAPVKTD
ncbi:MAG: efflux transporter outer membrane subunit [Nitrospirae bacterium]|nr:efflux transporter outer membrane subunit [Nitrospirota bacterium]